jgi:hypothetical protein
LEIAIVIVFIIGAAKVATGANDFSQTICKQVYNGRSPRPCHIAIITTHERHVASYVIPVESE